MPRNHDVDQVLLSEMFLDLRRLAAHPACELAAPITTTSSIAEWSDIQALHVHTHDPYGLLLL